VPTTGDIVYAPNISWLLKELPFSERARALAQAGFGAIEFGFPSQVDVAAIDAARQEYGLEVALFNQDVPVWDRSNRGYLSDPGRRDEFRRRLDEALVLARRLEARHVMLPAGVDVPGIAPKQQRDVVLENLHLAAPLAADAGVVLTIEVINPMDHPGYYLTSWDQAVGIVKEVNHPNVRSQFDTYHLRMVNGSLEDLFRQSTAWIGHVQFGDYPGRGQPGTGTIDFASLLDTARASGYRGYIGLEFVPRDAGLAALAWVPQAMRRRGGTTGPELSPKESPK
jgi:hydroxypyruvate isomerase